jgi:type VI secretion system secreted protein Hcp
MAEMFLEFSSDSGIKGESIDEASPTAHKNHIEILKWDWTTENTIKWDVNQGGQSTRMEVRPIALSKVVDSASAALYQCCVNGKHISSATITARKNDGDQKLEYLIVTLTDVMVNKVHWSGDGTQQNVTEDIELSFAQFHIKYQTQGEHGSGTPAGDLGWHVQKQKAA